MKSAALVSLASLVTAGVVLLGAPRLAAADCTDDFTCSQMDAPVTLTTQPMFTDGLDTGWVPKCDPATSSGHCDGTHFQVKASADFSDTKIQLAMPGIYSATWPGTGGTNTNLHIQVIPDATPPGGEFDVTYKLRPEFGVYFKWDSPSIGPFEFDVDVNTLLSLVPDGTGLPDQFDFSASGKQKFAPFAFDKAVEVQVNGDLGTVFSISASKLVGLVTGGSGIPYVNIDLGLVAGTKDTKFTWKTDKLEIQNVAVDPAKLEADVPFQGGDSAQLKLVATGTLGYSGTTTLEPQVTLSCICTSSDDDPASCKANSGSCFDISSFGNFDFDVGADVPFQGQIPNVQLKGSVTLPLPQVVVPTTRVDFGSIEVGNKVKKTITVQNFGQLTGTITNISSDDPSDFSAASTNLQIPPTMPLPVELDFVPKTPGAKMTTYTITTNDPSTPVVTIQAIGNATQPADETGGSGGAPPAGGSSQAGGGSPPDDEAGAGGSVKKPPKSTDDEAPSQDSGCGCRVAGEGNSGTAALAALAGLSILTIRRRKRSLSDSEERKTATPSPGGRRSRFVARAAYFGSFSARRRSSASCSSRLRIVRWRSATSFSDATPIMRWSDSR